MSDKIIPFPGSRQAVLPSPDGLGLYFRPARNDHRELLNLSAAGDAHYFGAVFDPTLVKRHGELRAQVLRVQLDAILDPKTQQSSLPGSYNDDLLEYCRGGSADRINRRISKGHLAEGCSPNSLNSPSITVLHRYYRRLTFSGQLTTLG